MTIARQVAIGAMHATELLAGNDFLRAAGIQAPVPIVPGALPAVAREPFSSRDIKKLFDLVVIFNIGDFPSSLECSNYYNPNSAWYNVFYGAYGLYSHKPEGVAWGFNPDGSPNYDEITQVPGLDYNFLTAGELGCPPDKMCFRLNSLTQGQSQGWATGDCKVTIPSGLHHREHAVKPNLEYYAVFGFPEKSFMTGGRADYEPVNMHGKMFFKNVKPRITLVWGGMCPDTPEGNHLLDQIVAAMQPLYP